LIHPSSEKRRNGMFREEKEILEALQAKLEELRGYL